MSWLPATSISCVIPYCMAKYLKGKVMPWLSSVFLFGERYPIRHNLFLEVFDHCTLNAPPMCQNLVPIHLESRERLKLTK